MIDSSFIVIPIMSGFPTGDLIITDIDHLSNYLFNNYIVLQIYPSCIFDYNVKIINSFSDIT